MTDYKDLPGYEGLYRIGSDGSIVACEKMQRYTHWRTGREMFRRVPEHRLSQQLINSGYRIVHLYRENKRTALLVHRLVAEAFVQGDKTLEVNHKNGDKQDNCAQNLEWVGRAANHKHALYLGLRKNAKQVRDPSTHCIYPAINEAARVLRKSPRTIRRVFEKVAQ